MIWGENTTTQQAIEMELCGHVCDIPAWEGLGWAYRKVDFNGTSQKLKQRILVSDTLLHHSFEPFSTTRSLFVSPHDVFKSC